jgi:hypothetical protein
MNAIDRAIEMLDGVEYTEEDRDSVFEYAKEHDLVIVFGASDDLIELRGAIEDETGAYDGGTIHLDKKGIIPEFNNIDSSDKEALRDYFSREGKGKKIEAIWCPEENGEVIASWAYKTEIPHKVFKVMEDDEVYCFGIVFDLAHLSET